MYVVQIEEVTSVVQSKKVEVVLEVGWKTLI